MSGLSVEHAGGGLYIAAANWAQSSSRVFYAYRESAELGDFQGTPFQVADGSHHKSSLAKLVKDWIKTNGG